MLMCLSLEKKYSKKVHDIIYVLLHFQYNPIMRMCLCLKPPGSEWIGTVYWWLMETEKDNVLY